MIQTSVVVVGGSRGSMEVGYGSYAIITAQRKRVTHVEFGSRMTLQEALYDTLIVALSTLIRQGNVSNIRLEVQCPVGEFVATLAKGRPSQSLAGRHNRVRELLAQFNTYELTTIPPAEAQRHIAG